MFYARRYNDGMTPSELEKLKKESVLEPRSHREWFLFYLFNDPDFIEKKDDILSNIKELVGIKALGVMLLLASSESVCVQLLRYPGQRSAEKIAASIEDLAKTFKVNVATVEMGLQWMTNLPNLVFKTTPTAGIEDEKVVIRIDVNTRLKDVEAIYWYVEKLQTQLPGYHPRNRNKDRTDLIYALHKQKLTMSWKEVYQLYEQGILPHYTGVSSISNEENLARMYKRYMPDI